MSCSLRQDDLGLFKKGADHGLQRTLLQLLLPGNPHASTLKPPIGYMRERYNQWFKTYLALSCQPVLKWEYTHQGQAAHDIRWKPASSLHLSQALVPRVSRSVESGRDASYVWELFSLPLTFLSLRLGGHLLCNGALLHLLFSTFPGLQRQIFI